jgi:hypothetical protein
MLKTDSSESKAKNINSGRCLPETFLLFVFILVFLSTGLCDSGDSPLKKTYFEDHFKFELGTLNYEFSAAILCVQTSSQQQQQQQPVKRKTWAESSILSGGVATALGSTYAQDYHQHTCPASKVHSQKRKSNFPHI